MVADRIACSPLGIVGVLAGSRMETPNLSFLLFFCSHDLKIDPGRQLVNASETSKGSLVISFNIRGARKEAFAIENWMAE